MGSLISQWELRDSGDEIVHRLSQGESFVVTRNGIPIGELLPLRRKRVVNGPALAAAFQRAPRIDYERFRDDLDRLTRH